MATRVLFTLAGMLAAQAALTGQTLVANCDNQCRERNDHWANGGATCIRFGISTCQLCTAYLGLCAPYEKVIISQTCADVGGGNYVYYDDACTPLCDGWQQAGRGEATNMSYSTWSFETVAWRYKCQL